MKTIGIIQSCYIPWRGFFDFIKSVDIFVLFDDVQYPVGRSWRNRNQIKTATGLQWLTVPVKDTQNKLIDEVEIGSPPKPWDVTQQRLLESALGKAPFFKHAMEIWQSGIDAEKCNLSRLNHFLITKTCHYLDIHTPILFSRNIQSHGAKTERLLSIIKAINGTHYISGPAAKDYIDESLFRTAGVGLSYKSYDYNPYPQLWGDFVGNVSILDLIANLGPESRDHIQSRSPNEIAVS